MLAKEELSIINRTSFEEYTDSWGSPENKAIYDGPVELLISRIKQPSLDFRTVHTQTDLILRESTVF